MRNNVGLRVGMVLVGLGAWEAPAQEKPPTPAMAPDRVAALDRISADSLRGHLSFLASDLLEGRDTPSRGLDLAAEYIAAQFRRAGLEPMGDDGYFQTANWEVSEPDASSFRFEVAGSGRSLLISPGLVSLTPGFALDLPATATCKVDFKAPGDVKAADLAGKVVLVELPDLRKADRAGRAVLLASINTFLTSMTEAKVALVVNVARGADASGLGEGVLIDPKNPRSSPLPRGDAPGRVPRISAHDSTLAGLFDAAPVGPMGWTIAVKLGPPVRRPVKLRNVAGLLRGSDPLLKETYVMVTAHYDHIGVRGAEGTDRIYNGANDDGSGTVSVIELASSLGTLKDRPKRSLLFVTFFGEEKGLLGSRYYGRNPLVPVAKTVSDVNLEQVGRTDDSEGPQVGSACLTGFGYSGVSKAFEAAGRLEGVKVYRHPTNSDAYFGRSDNQALADLGVPAHTLCVAFAYPDYHGAADHWDKVDYANMAKVDRMVGRALLTIADDPDEPRWDETNPRAARYLKAWNELHPK